MTDKDPNEQFKADAARLGLNMAVVMYMADALQYFSGMDKNKIKLIALDIALIGYNGIQPLKQEYKVKPIPEKEFSGFHLLAYYYVSCALFFPELLQELVDSLPYKNEYEMAKLFRKP